ncbi:hypothetical protein M2302_000256 [Micromonospora sp. A200]|uniref:hypothetical protein n=1 Tax=Micromonospora sp. A200 TaxID=2940568 RepID=UPI0024754933|nr:hypothetical protein [Micromonospora sp. A200]MDH6460105.1 hypothetical protein [Micromonospora sp. A200]
MTGAPANLLAARRLLLDHLNMSSESRSADLEPAEVGIVGDPAHRGGYHCGADRVVTNDYSVVESSRDRTGLTDYASALDVGDFSVSVAGKRHTLASFSMWLVAQCKAGSADTRDIREVIYSPDGVVVRRWDRLGRRTTGDSSHRWHTHISYHRDAIKAGRDQSAVFRRYLTYIGLIKAPTVEDDMSEKASQVIEAWAVGKTATPTGATVEPVKWRIRDEAWQRRVDGLLVALAASVEGLDMDAVLRRLDEHAAAEASRDAELRALVQASQSGELTAEQVLTKLRDLLPAGEPANPTQ